MSENTAATGMNQSKAAHTTGEAAAILGLSIHQMRALIRSGKIRTRSTGRRYLIPDSALREFLDGSDDPIAHPDSFGRAS